MDVSAHRAFSLLRELAFERVSGSAEEKKAAEVDDDDHIFDDILKIFEKRD